VQAILGTNIEKAISDLETGALVAIPTETVYGLAANALDAKAVAQIFAVKNRPTFDPLIVHGASMERIVPLVKEFPAWARTLAEKFWPGPLTLLLPRREAIIPDLVTAGSATVAVRVPRHPLTLSLLEKLSFPLAAPSANPFGYVSPTRAQHVVEQLGTKVAYVLDGGACEVGLESTIVGWKDNLPTVFRLGGLSVEILESVLGKIVVLPQSSSNPIAPGMLESHYAPHTPFHVGSIPELLKKYEKSSRIGVLTLRSYFPQISSSLQLQLCERGDLSEAGQRLFAAMRELDALKLDCIMAEKVPDEGLGRAINDRLVRAAARRRRYGAT